jgi:tripartite-type tricarboxylate transporter receptor subunit TctC
VSSSAAGGGGKPPGANGNIGADAVAKSAADGHTLLMSSGGAVTVNPFLYTKMPFDAEKDLVPVASVARVLVYLMTNPSVPVNTAQEFVTYAKANPGKLSFGSAGTGSSPHLAGEMFKRQAGFEATHVPYKGAAPALTDLLAGQVQFMFDPGPGLRHARDGKLRLLAVGSPRRSFAVPRYADAGRGRHDRFRRRHHLRHLCTGRHARRGGDAAARRDQQGAGRRRRWPR